MNISPKVDIAFKKIFGVEENKDLLISLINSIVSDEDKVADLTLLNPYNLKNYREDKLSILDIKAKGIDGKLFNIEIQIADEADYDKRALYYWGKLYTEQLRSGEHYSKLSKAIGIHILNFLSIPKDGKYHNVFKIKEKEDNFEYFKDLELHTIELTKFTSNEEGLEEFVKKIKNALDVWVAFLTRNDLLRDIELPKNLDVPEVNKALHVLEVMNFTAEERAVYEGQFKWLWIEDNALKKAKDDGIEEGIEQGKEERNIEIAINLIEQGIDLSIIATATGLTIEELTELKKQI